VVGTFGELNPAVLGKFDVKANRVAVAELKIGPLLRGDWDWSRVTTVNSMPMVIEDLAFVVADAVGAGRVQETIRRTGSGKVVGIELFDIFRGEVLGAGKKSLAFRVSYQVPNAAMTNEQVVALRNEIVQAVSLEHGGVLRAT
jgi:phenylalanyl-tRNA synthetase beta chain